LDAQRADFERRMQEQKAASEAELEILRQESQDTAIQREATHAAHVSKLEQHRLEQLASRDAAHKAEIARLHEQHECVVNRLMREQQAAAADASTRLEKEKQQTEQVLRSVQVLSAQLQATLML
jgi:hypothetical protein